MTSKYKLVKCAVVIKIVNNRHSLNKYCPNKANLLKEHIKRHSIQLYWCSDQPIHIRCVFDIKVSNGYRNLTVLYMNVCVCSYIVYFANPRVRTIKNLYDIVNRKKVKGQYILTFFYVNF